MKSRPILTRVALGVLLLIAALFFADLFGAPDWLGDVASAAWSLLAAGAGIVVLRDASSRSERIGGWVLVGAGCLSLVGWLGELLI